MVSTVFDSLLLRTSGRITTCASFKRIIMKLCEKKKTKFHKIFMFDTKYRKKRIGTRAGQGLKKLSSRKKWIWMIRR